MRASGYRHIPVEFRQIEMGLPSLAVRGRSRVLGQTILASAIFNFDEFTARLSLGASRYSPRVMISMVLSTCTKTYLPVRS